MIQMLPCCKNVNFLRWWKENRSDRFLLWTLLKCKISFNQSNCVEVYKDEGILYHENRLWVLSGCITIVILSIVTDRRLVWANSIDPDQKVEICTFMIMFHPFQTCFRYHNRYAVHISWRVRDQDTLGTYEISSCRIRCQGRYIQDIIIGMPFTSQN